MLKKCTYNFQKWTKNHTLYSTKLVSTEKCEFSVAHETHFKHNIIFKIRGLIQHQFCGLAHYGSQPFN